MIKGMSFLDLFKDGRRENNNRVFFDYASTTPIRPEVAKKMQEYDANNFANPSALYTEALRAKDLLTESREEIAEILNTQKKSIVFTSGGTEGNNLALLGIFEANKTKDFTPHFITTNIEHPAILEVCSEIERRGGKVTTVSVDEDGIINPKDIREALTPETVLVSVMYANNEIGTVQPIHEIGRVIKEWKLKNNTHLPYFHTDSCQAPLYLDLNVLKLGVDLMTLDGVKIYGPRGTGILYVKEGVNISPIIFGGGQEGGLRSGTEDVSSAIGFTEALCLAQSEKDLESERLINIRDYAIKKILDSFPKAKLNGSKEKRLPNNINICFPGLDAEFAVISLDVLGISASYSSSCRTLKEDSSSYVVEYVNGKDCSTSSLRFTLGRYTKMSDVDTLLLALKKIVK